MIHRDIKPGNLFLTEGGSLKLLDFGIAEIAAESQTSDSGEAISIMGTPEYMAPEQAGNEAVDERTDVYALGAVLYELVTGRLPHVAANTVALLDKKLRFDPEPPSLRAPQRGLGRAVDKTLLKALSLQPADRFQSAEALHDALQAALDAPARQRRRRRRVATGLVSAASLLLAIGAFRQSNDPGTQERAQAWLKHSGIMSWMPESSAEGTVTATLEETPSFELQLAAPEPATVAPTPAPSERSASVSDSENETDGDAVPEDVATDDPDPASVPAPPMHAEPAASDPVERALANAEIYVSENKKAAALAAYRKLGAKYEQDPRVLEGWSRAAVKTRSWGEALRIALRWGAVDETPTAQLYLARVQKQVGQRYGAIATIKRVLAVDPHNKQGLALLDRYQGKRVAMLDN